MYRYREYFRAKVYTFWVHGPLGLKLSLAGPRRLAVSSLSWFSGTDAGKEWFVALTAIIQAPLWEFPKIGDLNSRILIISTPQIRSP